MSHGARFSQVDRDRKKKQEWAKAGLCKLCGKEKEDNGFLHCEGCLKRARGGEKREKEDV